MGIGVLNGYTNSELLDKHQNDFKYGIQVPSGFNPLQGVSDATQNGSVEEHFATNFPFLAQYVTKQ